MVQQTQNTPPVVQPIEQREAGLSIATGFQGTGKSYQTLHLIYDYLKRHPNRKVLIYDVNREYDHESCLKHGIDMKIPLLNPTTYDILRFSAHKTDRIRRIIPVNFKNGMELNIQQKKDLLILILQNFRAGLLLIEDVNKYLQNIRHLQDVLSSLISLRHRNLDVILHLQSLSKLDPTMWENVKFIRMHWQNDSIDRYENRIPNPKLIKIAQLLIEYKRDECDDARFYLWVHNQTNKLVGRFSKRDFKIAFYRYLKIEKTEMTQAARIMQKNLENKNQRLEVVDHCFNKALSMYGNAV